MIELSGHDHATYEAVFRHPTSGNIEWRDLIAMFKHLGNLEQESNGKLKFTRNEMSMVLNPQGKDADAEIIADIRKFLTKTDGLDGGPGSGADFLLVISHSEARVYRSETPASASIHIEPYDPRDHGRHVHDHHETAPPHMSNRHHEFFERIGNALVGAARILILGDGTGSSQEHVHFLADLRTHHPKLADLVIETVSIDSGHMTEGQVLALAREHFANNKAAPVIPIG